MLSLSLFLAVFTNPLQKKIFFEWDDQSGHYFEVDSENFSDDFGNYAIG